jgi:hypothetical protein
MMSRGKLGSSLLGAPGDARLGGGKASGPVPPACVETRARYDFRLRL